MTRKRFAIVGTGVALVSAIVYFSSGGDGDAEKKPEFAEVERGYIEAAVSTTGRVVPNRDVEIKCKASGTIVSVPFDVSDAVKKGDLLVALDPVDEQRRVTLAEVALAGSRATVEKQRASIKAAEATLAAGRRKAEASLASAKAQCENARARADRMQTLLKKELASREECDAAETAAIQAEGELENARARLEESRAEELALEAKRQDVVLAKARARSDEITLADARQRLRETKVYAPIDGVVSSRRVEPGQIVASGVSNIGGGTTLITVADLGRIYVLAAVDESDIGRIRTGQDAVVAVDAYPERSFTGVVERIATRGESSSNVVTFEVKIEVRDEHRSLLKPEMTANVEIVIAKSDDTLIVPIQAVTRKRGGHVVNVSGVGGETSERTIEIGVRNDSSVEVVSGLEEGESVELGSGLARSRWQREGDGEGKGGRKRGPRMFGPRHGGRK
jgi:multidrug efflux pump subunit AcrA (membrane-fusion protein)